MPPHLHPKSRSTISLFSITLFASLFVVGLPHLFPGPNPRRILADSEMIMTADGRQIHRVRRIRRKDTSAHSQDDCIRSDQAPLADDEEVSTFLQLQEEAKRLENVRRECPAPGPMGRLRELLGFKDRDDE